MRAASWLKALGFLALVGVWQTQALQEIGGVGTDSLDVAKFLLGLVGAAAGISLIVASDWFADRIFTAPVRGSVSMRRYLRNRRLLQQGFGRHVRRAGGLPEPPGRPHDPEFLEAWVAGDFFLCERLVEMRGQEVANLPEEDPKALVHEHYKDLFERAREAVFGKVNLVPRTSSILDETD